MIKDSRIAVLLTCYNRKNKTINALRSLFDSIEFFENKFNKLQVTVYLTNDGCTDGTPEEVEKQFTNKNIVIINADGNAYWAGGMRMAWKEAIKDDYDFYLLINDDTLLKNECICELFNTNNYALTNFGKRGVYSGFVSSAYDESRITYGAKKYYNSFKTRAELLHPIGKPQECTLVNANILLVSKDVVDSIGILDDIYIHAAADMDYGMKAYRKGFPVLTTSYVCGFCENDHDNSDTEREKVVNMTLKERKAYIDRPNIKQYHDSAAYYWRYDKLRFVLLKCSYFLNLFCPSIYYRIYKRRNH